MYCTKCGKKLEDGEVCTCTQTGAAPQMRPVQHTQQPVQPEKADQNIQAEHYTSQSTQQPRQNSQSTQQPGQSSQSARKPQHTQSGSGAQQPRYTQQAQYTGQVRAASRAAILSRQSTQDKVSQVRILSQHQDLLTLRK